MSKPKKPAKKSPSIVPQADGGLRDLLLGWLSAKKAATQRTYKADLEDFAAFWSRATRTRVTRDAALLALFSLSAPEANAVVLQYRMDLLTRPAWSKLSLRREGAEPDLQGLAPATVNRRLAALRSIAKLARIAGRFDGQIEIEGVKARKYRDTKGIGPNGYKKMARHLDSLVESMREDPPAGRAWAHWPRALRDRAIVHLLHDAGLRRVEVVRLRMQDVLFDRKAVRLMPKGPEGDTEIWELGAGPWSAIMSWLKWRGEDAGPLFHGVHQGTRRHMDLSLVNKIITERGADVGLKVRPHGLRHTAITTALDKTDGNVRAVAKFSRHKSIQTVMVYDDQRRGISREIQDLISENDED